LEPALRHSVTIKDERGELSKFFLDIDFIPQEFFIIKDVPLGALRGQHAHFKCKQLIMLIKGKLNVSLESKISNKTVLLNNPGSFVVIPALTWSKQEYLSINTEIIVFCSEEFDEKDYIRDYQYFKKLI
jgi:hypothetical protein